MNGAEYIAEFLSQKNIRNVYWVTGGACAFIADAIAQHPSLEYICVHHEQAAALAADAVWRVDHSQIGVTLCTSGPGATNLITGIGCSFFDSIPSLHITGQVNISDHVTGLVKEPRQTGFQETNIVDMVRPITKHAVRVESIQELKDQLVKGYDIATTGRMGPVLIDVPMNVQQDDAGERIDVNLGVNNGFRSPGSTDLLSLTRDLGLLLASSHRPLLLFGAGIGLAGVEQEVLGWLEHNEIPFVSSWNGQAYFNHGSDFYFGNIGVYGNRGANYILQNCDLLLSLGNRLDTRQRTATRQSFAAGAKVVVIDIDQAELDKFGDCDYVRICLDLRWMPKILEQLPRPVVSREWGNYLGDMKRHYFRKEVSNSLAKKTHSLSPRSVICRINDLIGKNSIVIVGCGGITCWTYQYFHATTHTLFTSGGMAPMGYTLGAGIGAALTCPERPVVLIEGDGGFQLNIQELQTIRHHSLNIKIVLLNNRGFGIIRQFQDLYFEGRYEASDRGISFPDFGPIVRGYGLDYYKVENLTDLEHSIFRSFGPAVVDVALHPNTLIQPKTEMGNPINDQFPYVTDEEFEKANRFVPYQRRPRGDRLS
jgi:acetolactate synthase I/II/III large subunit